MKLDASSQYHGNKGKAYFAYQNQGGQQRGRINSRKFSPFIKAADTVLDFGCANGSLLAHVNCRNRIGIEVNPAAREEAISLGLEVHASLDSIPQGSIDIVISNHVMEHVLSPLETLSELRMRLKPNGRIVLCLPIDDWRTQKTADPTDINHHLYTWTPLLIGHLLSEAGFHVVRAWVYAHAWPPRYWQFLDHHLPVWMFDLACRFVAWRDNRRQLMVIGINP
jgi:SAM-dependent methyltransferase